MRCFSVVWIALVLGAAIRAQPGCQVSGTVVRADGQRPLIRVAVTASRTGGGSAQELTNGQGRFCFHGLPAGDYLVSARKSLYAATLYGATPGHTQGKMVALAAGATVQDLLIVMPRLGSVTGHVVSEDGEPARTARVALLRLNYRRGKAAVTVANHAPVDIRGNYRFSAVQPGKYYLSASDNDPGTQWQPAAGEPVQRSRTARVYYPAANDFDSARLIEVKPGQEVRGLDLTLNHQPDAKVEIRGSAPVPCSMQVRFLIHGRGINANDLLVTQVFFSRRQSPEAGSPDLNEVTAHVPPGNYRLLAECAEGSGKGSYRALEEVAVTGDTTIDVRLSRGAELQGTVALQGPSERKLTEMSVRLVPGDTAFQATNLAAAIDGEGHFTIKDVPPGVWDFAVDGMPRHAFIQSGMLGNQDVLFEDMTIGNGISDALHIVVNTRGATVRGKVDHLVDGRAYVILEPTGHERNPLINQQTVTGGGGKFELNGLRPGTYRAYALLDSRPSDTDPSAPLAELEAQATVVEVKEGEVKEVTLSPLSLETTAGGGKP